MFQTAWIYVNPNDWMIKEVQCLLKDRNIAFRSGDGAQYSAGRANLKRGIREIKAPYKRKVKDYVQSNNTNQVWQEIQLITSNSIQQPLSCCR